MRKDLSAVWAICVLMLGGFVGLSSLTSCNYALNDIEAPTWEPELLAPVARSSMEMGVLNDFITLDQTYELYASDLGMPLGPVFPVTATMGPLNVNLSNEIQSVTSDTIIVDLELINSMPFNVDPGMEVVIRDTVSNAVIYTETLPYGVMSGETRLEQLELINTLLPSDLRIYLENVIVVPEPGLPPIDASHHFDVNAQLQYSRLSQIVVKPSQLIDFQDTTDFELNLDNEDGLTGEGYFNILVNNTFPFGGSFQAYFMDATGTVVIDSLVTTAVGFTAPPIGVNGEVTSAENSVLSIPISNEKVEMLGDAELANFIFRLYSPNGSTGYIIDETSILDLKLIADIKLTLEP